MTCRDSGVECIVVAETKLGAGEVNGDYLWLDNDELVGSGEEISRGEPRKWISIWWWIRAVVLGACLLAAAVPVIIFVAPWIIKKVVIPILNWEMATFSRPVLCLLLFASIALFPIFLLPTAPSMWLAGITFGYGYGFLLLVSGISIGMSLPFFVGSLFHHKIHRWLQKWPKNAAFIRLAGEGDWSHQFRAVILIRISPFPYIIFNYAAVATNLRFGPYILGSLVGTVHEIFITIYSGRLLLGLADATNTCTFLSVPQIVYDVIGFCIAAAASAAITIYAKRTIQALQLEDELS